MGRVRGNASTSVENDRFLRSVRWSRRAAEPFRRKRSQIVRAMYGAHWQDGSFAASQPVNMLELTVRIWLRNLVAKAPTVSVTARDRKWKPLAADFELVLRQVIREIDLAHALEDAAFDALTCPLGCVKTGITDAALGEARGFLHDAGLPFCDPVDFDDLAVDMASGRLEAMAYAGDRYALPYEMAMDSKLFRSRGHDSRIEPKRYATVNDEFGNRKVRELETVAAGDGSERDAEEMLELWDFWKPRHRVVCSYVTGADGMPTGDPVRTVEWTGPEIGPYVFLSYGKGKGIMRLPPVAALKDLHDTINRNFRKLDRQSGRQKTVTAVQAGAEADADRVVNASDGETVKVERTDSIREMRFGGADPSNLAFSLQLRDIYSYMAGNLDSQGGLSQSAGTLGQEELIRESASQTTEDMRTTTVRFARKAIEALASWVWYDPERIYLVDKPLGDSGIAIPVRVDPKDREEADFLEMAFDIMPSSMVDTSNGQRLRTMQVAIERTLLPLMPAVQANGDRVDVRGILANMADLTDTPELADMVTAAPVSDAAAMAADSHMGSTGNGRDGPDKPPVTRREYVRRNVATGGTRSARDNAIAQRAMGGNITPQQEAMLGRS